MKRPHPLPPLHSSRFSLLECIPRFMTLAKSTTSSAWRNPLLAALDHYAWYLSLPRPCGSICLISRHGVLDFPKCCSCSSCSPSSSPRSAVHGPCKHAESFPDGQFTPKGIFRDLNLAPPMNCDLRAQTLVRTQIYMVDLLYKTNTFSRWNHPRLSMLLRYLGLSRHVHTQSLYIIDLSPVSFLLLQ